MPAFNGAAGVNPRIAKHRAEIIASGRVLQWGRGCEPADRPSTGTQNIFALLPSMGPRV